MKTPERFDAAAKREAYAIDPEHDSAILITGANFTRDAFIAMYEALKHNAAFTCNDCKATGFGHYDRCQIQPAISKAENFLNARNVHSQPSSANPAEKEAK